MQGQQSQTGVGNIQYDLVSVMYHALQGGQTYAQYITDAQQSGNQELVQFFQQVQQEDSQRAQQALQLLSKYAGQGGGQSTSQSGMGQSSTR